MDSFLKIVEGVPNGLVTKPRPELLLPSLEGETLWFWSVEEGNDDLKWKVGLTISSFGLMHCLLSWSLDVVVVVVVGLFGPVILLLVVAASCCWAALLGSDGPVSLCTTSLKDFVSVCTNVVKGLQPAVTWVGAGFSMIVNYFIGENSLLFC